MEISEQNAQYVQDAIAGSDVAFAELMRVHAPALIRFVERMLRDSRVAEDVVQETFLKVWKSLHTFDQQKKISTWLFQIAKNTAIDYARKKKIPVVSFTAYDDGERDIFEFVPSAEPLPDAVLARAETISEIYAAVETLGPAMAMVVRLHLEEGLTFAEISVVLGQSIDTVKSRYRRALLRLREELAPKFGA